MARPVTLIPAAVRAQLRAAAKRSREAEAELHAAVAAAAAGGASVREIAKVVGRSPTTVQKWVTDSRH